MKRDIFIIMSSFGPHLTAGIITGVIGCALPFALNISYPETFQYTVPLIAGISGALTPDMDIKSKSSQCMYILYFGLALYLYYIDRIDLGFLTLLYAVLPQFFGHRGFIHSGLFGVLSTVGLFHIIYYNSNSIVYSGIIAGTYFLGFLTHIILDNI